MMPTLRNTIVACLVAFGGPACLASSEAEENVDSVTVTFGGVEFHHRRASGNQHVFTVVGQEDLDNWAEMITINYFPTVTNSEGLADTANRTLDNFKSHEGTVWGTDTIPKTDDKPGKFLITASFVLPNCIEVGFTSLQLLDGIGLSLAFAHREYGEGKEERMDAWVRNHSEATQSSLSTLEKIPTLGEVGDNVETPPDEK